MQTLLDNQQQQFHSLNQTGMYYLDKMKQKVTLIINVLERSLGILYKMCKS